MVTETIMKIDRVLGRINTHPEYSAQSQKEFHIALRDEAERHSLVMEIRREVNGNDKKKLEKKKSLENLNNARNYLLKWGIDVSSLAVLGNVIEPLGHTKRDFRKTEVNLGVLANEVPGRIENLVYRLKHFQGHPVKRAIEAHLDFVRIHPYVDGNGRAARLLQDFTLQERGYPPVIIKAGEREHYFGLLQGAIDDRYKEGSTIDGPGKREGVFHSFIESKVLDSSEFIEQELKARRIYDVIVREVNNPAVTKSIKRYVSNLSRRPGNRGIAVKIAPYGKNSTRMEVIGDVSTEDLDRVLDRATNKYGTKYNLEPRKGCCCD